MRSRARSRSRPDGPSAMMPAPRPASGPALRPVPSRLRWPQARAAGRPVTGDALLLQYLLHKRRMRSVTELTAPQGQAAADRLGRRPGRGRSPPRPGRPGRDRCGPEQERGPPADRHRADHHRPHRRRRPGHGSGPAMTAICAVCVAVARPYPPRICGRARHDARLPGTADLQSRTVAVMPGPPRHDGKDTANAVGPCGPPGFKSPILRSDQQFRPGAPSRGTAGFRFPGPLRGHRRNPAARLPHRCPPPRGPAMPGIRAGSPR